MLSKFWCAPDDNIYYSYPPPLNVKGQASPCPPSSTPMDRHWITADVHCGNLKDQADYFSSFIAPANEFVPDFKTSRGILVYSQRDIASR